MRSGSRFAYVLVKTHFFPLRRGVTYTSVGNFDKLHYVSSEDCTKTRMMNITTKLKLIQKKIRLSIPVHVSVFIKVL